jgi:hypothetical protein
MIGRTSRQSEKAPGPAAAEDKASGRALRSPPGGLRWILLREVSIDRSLQARRYQTTDRCTGAAGDCIAVTWRVRPER